MWATLRAAMTPTPPKLALVDLAVRRGPRTVLERVTFHAGAGEIVAVLGPNGGGKTTLLEAMVGVLPRAHGRIFVGGRSLTTFRACATAFAYMPDEASLPDEVAIDTLLGPERSPLEESLGVTALRGARGSELSRGEAKRVWLVLTLAQERPVVVLDEPFGAFDPLQLDDVLDVVRRRARAGQTVVVTIHQMSTAERIADRVVLLANGSVAAAGALDVLHREYGSPTASADDVFRAVLARTHEAVRAPT
ncbi:MAG: Heme transporter, ATPase component HmuV [Labilithrix sp.]|nr:Heme transporter, ATPase component HmuV [Labilithrix sp.]